MKHNGPKHLSVNLSVKKMCVLVTYQWSDNQMVHTKLAQKKCVRFIG